MIMRERLYKDAHPLHKVSKKNFFLFYFLRENPLAKNGKRNFFILFFKGKSFD